MFRFAHVMIYLTLIYYALAVSCVKFLPFIDYNEIFYKDGIVRFDIADRGYFFLFDRLS